MVRVDVDNHNLWADSNKQQITNTLKTKKLMKLKSGLDVYTTWQALGLYLGSWPVWGTDRIRYILNALLKKYRNIRIMSQCMA